MRKRLIFKKGGEGYGTELSGLMCQRTAHMIHKEKGNKYSNNIMYVIQAEQVDERKPVAQHIRRSTRTGE